MIATYQGTKEILERYGLLAKKNFGQNFLIDPHVLQKIIIASDIGPNDTVIEVGPGIGGLTEALAREAGQVIAIEIDRSLLPVLADTLGAYANITVIHGDILKLDLRQVIKEQARGPVKLAANLPYYITTPIIMNVLEQRLPIESLTVMVQKEVGDRMQAGPGTKDYGALSLAVRYYADCYLAANVPRNCFMPRPNVDSAVIRLTVLPEPRVKVSDEALLFTLIKAGFFQRRKTLINCLSHYPQLQMERAVAAALLEAAGLPQDVRGEKLTLEDYANLTEALKALTKYSDRT